MITSEQAHDLAKSYSQDLGEVLPGIYFSVKAAGEFSHCYYFDFIISDKQGNLLREPPMIGGAPGVIVDKLTGTVKTISFGELSKLR